MARRRPATVAIGGVPVTVPAGAFLQASAAGEAALTGLVLDAVGRPARAVDLFAGLGTFTLPLSGRTRVRAVDGDGEALAALEDAARAAGRAGRIEAERRNLFRDPLSAAELAGVDAAVFDPPDDAGAAVRPHEPAPGRAPPPRRPSWPARRCRW